MRKFAVSTLGTGRLLALSLHTTVRQPVHKKASWQRSHPKSFIASQIVLTLLTATTRLAPAPTYRIWIFKCCHRSLVQVPFAHARIQLIIGVCRSHGPVVKLNDIMQRTVKCFASVVSTSLDFQMLSSTMPGFS
jgi:hypothetical protein